MLVVMLFDDVVDRVDVVGEHVKGHIRMALAEVAKRPFVVARAEDTDGVGQMFIGVSRSF